MKKTKTPNKNFSIILLLILFTVVCIMLFLKISSKNIENPGILFARFAYFMSIDLNQLTFSNGVVNWLSELTELFRETRAQIGLIEIIFLFPTGLVFSILGVSEGTFLLLPTFYYCLSIIFSFLLGYSLSKSKEAGLVLAFFWSILPATIFPARAGLFNTFFIAITLLGLFEISKAVESKGRNILFWIICAFLIITLPALGFFLVIFWAYSTKIEFKNFEKFGLSSGEIIAFSIVIINLLIPAIAKATIQLLSDLISSPAILLTIFFSISSQIFLTKKFPRKENFHGQLLVFSYLLYLILALFPQTSNLIQDQIKELPLMLFIFSLLTPISEMIASIIPSIYIKIVLAVGIAVLIPATYFVDLSFYLEKDIFIGDPILSISRISEGLLLSLFLVYSYLLFSRSKSFLRISTGIVILLFPISMLFPLASFSKGGLDMSADYRKAALISKEIFTQNIPKPIFACGHHLRDRLWYLLGFHNFSEKIEDQRKNPFGKFPLNVEELERGIAIIDATIIDGECDDISKESIANWTLLYVFGQEESEISFYQIETQ